MDVILWRCFAISVWRQQFSKNILWSLSIVFGLLLCLSPAQMGTAEEDAVSSLGSWGCLLLHCRRSQCHFWSACIAGRSSSTSEMKLLNKTWGWIACSRSKALGWWGPVIGEIFGHNRSVEILMSASPTGYIYVGIDPSFFPLWNWGIIFSKLL